MKKIRAISYYAIAAFVLAQIQMWSVNISPWTIALALILFGIAWTTSSIKDVFSSEFSQNWNVTSDCFLPVRRIAGSMSLAVILNILLHMHDQAAQRKFIWQGIASVGGLTIGVIATFVILLILIYLHCDPWPNQQKNEGSRKAAETVNPLPRSLPRL